MSIHNKIREWETGPGIRLMREVGIEPHSRVLDLGCGFGHYAVAVQSLLGQNGHLIALDKNKRVLKHFSSRNDNSHHIEYQAVDLADLDPAWVRMADYILLYDMIHASWDRFAFLAFLKRHMSKQCVLSILPFHLSNFRNSQGKKARYIYKKIIDEMDDLGFVLRKEIRDKGIHFEKYHSPTIMARGDLTFDDLERGRILNFSLK